MWVNKNKFMLMRDYHYEVNKFQHSKIKNKYSTHAISKHIDSEAIMAYDELTKSSVTTIDVTHSMWYGFQKHRIKNNMELEYESLSSHPMWIPKEQRINFHKKQTRLEL